MTELLSNKLAKVVSNFGYGLEFFCPGCQENHAVWVGEGDRPRWEYNNNHEKPTFTPSILVTSGHYVANYTPDKKCWCTFEERFGRPAPFKCRICHSFITDGVIQFLPDCSHELAGQSVPLPNYRDEAQNK